MAKTCETCDGELDPERDKAGGSYHAKCLPCLRRQAQGRDKHYHQCTDETCLVCQDYAEERREQAQGYLLERAVGGWDNQTLDEFR